MLKQALPLKINAIKFANSEMAVEACLPLLKMDRLRSVLADGSESSVVVEIAGTKDEYGDKVINLSIKGTVFVNCQTCFQDMSLDVNSSVSLAPVFNDEQAGAIPPRFEPLMMDENGQFCPTELVEDELLLCIPSANNHPKGSCKVVLEEYQVKPEAVASEKRENPFAALKDLKKNLSSKK
jgi:uncharacterized protein